METEKLVEKLLKIGIELMRTLKNYTIQRKETEAEKRLWYIAGSFWFG